MTELVQQNKILEKTYQCTLSEEESNMYDYTDMVNESNHFNSDCYRIPFSNSDCNEFANNFNIHNSECMHEWKIWNPTISSMQMVPNDQPEVVKISQPVNYESDLDLISRTPILGYRNNDMKQLSDGSHSYYQAINKTDQVIPDYKTFYNSCLINNAYHKEESTYDRFPYLTNTGDFL